MSNDSVSADELPRSFVEFRRRAFMESADIVDSATAPIVFLKDDKSTFDRSGVLLAIGDFHFLITAETGYVLCITAARHSIPMTPIVFDKMYLSHNAAVDLAILRLEPKAVDRLVPDYRFLRLDRVRIFPPQPGEGPFFLVTGFPYATVDVDEESRRRANISRYLTMPYQGANETIDDFLPESHIVLEYSQVSNHTSGHIGPPPTAPGLSGCGMWYLRTPYGTDRWTNADVELVGIQTSWHRARGYVKGTIISHALAMIWGWFSDIRDAMRLHGLQYKNGRMQIG
jgi:hypothetical protein